MAAGALLGDQVELAFLHPGALEKMFNLCGYNPLDNSDNIAYWAGTDGIVSTVPQLPGFYGGLPWGGKKGTVFFPSTISL